MKTKFKRSSIQIGGELYIWDNEYRNNKLELKGLNQSKSGVYCIRNKFNGRLYIGMARNLEVRKRRHSLDLLKGIHCSNLLQDDYNKYTIGGIESAGNPLYSEKVPDISPWHIFEFEVIIYCRPSELTFYEHLLITNLNPYYNVHKQKLIEFDETENTHDLQF